MKVKTSITLSEDLLQAIEQKSSEHKSRSDFIENALWVYLRHLIRQEAHQNDLAIINANADTLNNEATDVLEFQGSI